MSSSPDQDASKEVPFIKQANPEAFTIQPRKGNFSLKDAEMFTSTRIGEDFDIKRNVSKEFRVQTALDDADSGSDDDATVPNVTKDAMYMIGVAISTIILLASGQDAPEGNLKWTKHCLECVRDEFGNHPPNVQALLNHFKKHGLCDPPAPGEYDGDQTIRTKTRVKIQSGEEPPEEATPAEEAPADEENQ